MDKVLKTAGVSGNSVAGKSYQMFTVSEELLAKVVEAVQAGEKEARSSGIVQSFEVFYHGFRQNIAIGRIYIVPASVCSDRKNFPVALLYGAIVRVFGTGGEELADLIEKKIGDSEFDEYSQADFDSIKKDLFVDETTGKEASLIVYAPMWENKREFIAFHFTKDSEKLKHNLRHQVFSAYYDPRVSSAFDAMMTNVNTTKVDVTDITPKIPFPFLSENLLKEYPKLIKQAGDKRPKVLLNHKTADAVTKEVLEPAEMDVFDSLNQALENSLTPSVDSAEEAGYKTPSTKDDVPRVASMTKVSYVAHCPGHKNSKGESAEWCVKSHKDDHIISSHKTEAEAKQHLQDMHAHSGSKQAADGTVEENPQAAHETPVTNVGPGTEAEKLQKNTVQGIKDGPKDVGRSGQPPIGIPIDETGVPRREGEKQPKAAKRTKGMIPTMDIRPEIGKKNDMSKLEMDRFRNGGYVEREHPEGIRQFCADLGSDKQAGDALRDHAKQLQAGGYGDQPLEKSATDKWGNAKVSINFPKKAADDFTRAYIEAALWSSTDNSTPSGGESLDKNYGPEDIAPESLREIGQVCQEFQRENAELLQEAYQRPGYGRKGQWSSEAQAGHDFWLSRNGHGTGFWDRQALEEGGLGDKLHAAAKAYGESDPYIGDNGEIYFYEESGKGKPPAEVQASYVASKMGKIVDSDWGHEVASDAAKKARAKKESNLDKFRSKEAVSLDIDSIWDEITEDMGPAPIIELEHNPDNPAPSNTEEAGPSFGTEGESESEAPSEEKKPSVAPRKRDVGDLPEAMRSDEPEDDKSMTDSEADAQEDSTPEDEPKWHTSAHFADFVDEVYEDTNNEDEVPEGYQRVNCDQCEMLSINGIPCHEQGCPNSNSRWDADSQSWIKQRECRECGGTVDADDPCCNAPFEEDDEIVTFGDQEEDEHEASAKTASGHPYDVFVNGVWANRVFYDEPDAADDVKRSLINHDGYYPGIEVEPGGVNIPHGQCWTEEELQMGHRDRRRRRGSNKNADTADNPANEKGGEGAMDPKTNKDKAKTADTADNEYDIDAAPKPKDKELGQSPTVECHKKTDEKGQVYASKKKADTADNPANMAGGDGAIAVKDRAVVKDTSGPTPDNTKAASKKKAEAVSGDIAEAKSEVDYCKSEVADEPRATDTVNPEHFAGYDDDLVCEICPSPVGEDVGKPGITCKGCGMTLCSKACLDSHYKSSPECELEAKKVSADVSGDMSEAKSELNYNKADMANEPQATQVTAPVDMEQKTAEDISGDMSEASSEVDYNKSQIADEPAAEDTVNPEHFAGSKKADKGVCSECGRQRTLGPNGMCHECEQNERDNQGVKSSSKKKALGPCMCGDTNCPSCGSAMGTWPPAVCPLDGKPAEDCTEHFDENGEVLPQFAEAMKAAEEEYIEAQRKADQGLAESIQEDSRLAEEFWNEEAKAQAEHEHRGSKEAAAGDEFPEDVQFDFGAGDLADIVMTEDEDADDTK